MNTRSYEEALVRLRLLDRVRAVELGLIDASALQNVNESSVAFDEGVQIYLDHVGRPRVAGGAKPGTVKRYRPILAKCVAYLCKQGLTAWNQVNKNHLIGYARWLEDHDYDYGGQYVEITTVKQIIKFLVEENYLPEANRIRLSMSKPTGTNTYCYRMEEVKAMFDLCRANTKLVWLGHVLVALAFTGLRISEVASLRWSDIRDGMILLTDDSRGRRAKARNARSTKNSRSRSLPVHVELNVMLESLRIADASGRIFHAPKGGLLRPDRVRDALVANVLKPLAANFPSGDEEIGFKDGRLHSFRHFFCSFSANSGVPEAVVMQWLGHQNSAMVRHYYQLHDQEAQRQMRKLKFSIDAGES